MQTPSLPSGQVLRDPEGSLASRLVVAGFVIPIGVLIVSLLAGVAVGLVVGAIVIGLAVLIGADSLRAALTWNPPQLQVASTPYALGSTPVVTYRRKPKRPTDVSNFGVECRLTCREEATYTHGSDTSTETRNVLEQRCNGNGEGTADGLFAEIELPISAHVGAPSMQLSNNKVIWFVTVEVSGPRLPKDSHRFAIDVGPVLDASVRHGVQDS